MRFSIHSLPSALALVAPTVLVHWGWGILGTVLAALAAILVRQYLIIKKIANRGDREGTRRLILCAHSLSHFVERVRWCLDYAGFEYEEEQVRFQVIINV